MTGSSLLFIAGLAMIIATVLHLLAALRYMNASKRLERKEHFLEGLDSFEEHCKDLV